MPFESSRKQCGPDTGGLRPRYWSYESDCNPTAFLGNSRYVDLLESGHTKNGLYWQVKGEGRAVLFIHAGVADSRMWRDQMDLAGFRCVVFDQRGFGQTPWVSGSYADWRDALEVLDHLQIESAVVVGCSLGGGIAMHLALSVPERVDGLVLIGAAARGWEPKDGWTEIPEVDEAEAASAAGDVERVLELEAAIWLAGLGRSLDDIDPSLVKLFIEMDRIPAVTEVERNRHVESFDPPTNESLDEINAPTLIMVGAYDLAEMLESARYLAVRLSDQPAIVVEDAAHLPSLEQPDRVNKALLAFLNSRVRS